MNLLTDFFGKFFFTNTSSRMLCIVHEGRKDYKCKSCGKSFSHGNALKKHIHTIHVGLKEYKCDICGKLFYQVGNMNSHIQKVHK